MRGDEKKAFGQCARYFWTAFLPPMRKRVAREITLERGTNLPANAVFCLRRAMNAAAVNLILFGPCMALAIALDCLPNMNLWLRTGLGAVGCCLAFDFFGDCLQRKLLKLGFLALCVIMDGYWTVTVMMMITFENITWEERLK